MYQGPTLRRRAYLGLKVGRAPGAGGLAVLRVTAGGPAERAGVRAGDLLAAIDDRELREVGDFVECVRTLASDRAVALRVEREGARLDLVSRPVPLPTEAFADGEVRLEEVRVGGHLLRAIYTAPRSPDPHAGVLYLQGLGAGSCEFPLDPEAPVRRLIEGWTRSGLVTLRLERSGVGDSEGPAYRDTDFELELAAARAALAHLSSRSFVDPQPLFLFGHSVGGMIAPLLAADDRPRLRGIAVFGTSALPWDECLVGAVTRQQQLAGLSARELDAVVRRWTELYGLVCREGLTPGEAFARHPHLAPCRSADVQGALLFDRCVAFSRQLQAVDLARAWRSITAPTLVLHGENDWICSREEAHGIVDLTAASPAGRARFIELPRLGHDLRPHDDSLLEATRAWIAERRTGAQPSAVSHGNTQP